MVGDNDSVQMRQESSPTVKMLRPMLGHGTQVRQRSIGEQTSGSLVDKEQTMNKPITPEQMTEWVEKTWRESQERAWAEKPAG